MPEVFWRLTMRELFAVFAGANKKRIRERQLYLSQAWQTANFTNARRLPPLEPLLRKLDPTSRRVMSPRAIRGTILGMAEAMGAEIIIRKKGEGNA